MTLEEQQHDTILKLQLINKRDCNTIKELHELADRYEKTCDKYRSALEFKDNQIKDYEAQITELRNLLDLQSTL